MDKSQWLGRLEEAMTFWDGPLVCVAGVPLPPQPDLLPKIAYEPLSLNFYLSLWDALQYMEEVSAAG